MSGRRTSNALKTIERRLLHDASAIGDVPEVDYASFLANDGIDRIRSLAPPAGRAGAQALANEVEQLFHDAYIAGWLMGHGRAAEVQR